jgi:hypothetical protein
MNPTDIYLRAIKRTFADLLQHNQAIDIQLYTAIDIQLLTNKSEPVRPTSTVYYFNLSKMIDESG